MPCKEAGAGIVVTSQRTWFQEPIVFCPIASVAEHLDGKKSSCSFQVREPTEKTDWQRDEQLEEVNGQGPKVCFSQMQWPIHRIFVQVCILSQKAQREVARNQLVQIGSIM